MNKHGLPPHLFSDSPSRYDSEARVMVDVAETGFFQGREFRISYEYDIANGNTLAIKFSSPIDFILQKQSLSCDVGGLAFRAYRSTDGSPSGTFGTPVNVLQNNAMTASIEYTRQASVTSGGSFTPSGDASETIRVRSGTATGQRISVGSSTADQRGLPAGDYYLLFENIANSGAAEGVYDLVWEERPDDLDDWLINEFGDYD